MIHDEKFANPNIGTFLQRPKRTISSRSKGLCVERWLRLRLRRRRPMQANGKTTATGIERTDDKAQKEYGPLHKILRSFYPSQKTTTFSLQLTYWIVTKT